MRATLSSDALWSAIRHRVAKCYIGVAHSGGAIHSRWRAAYNGQISAIPEAVCTRALRQLVESLLHAYRQCTIGMRMLGRYGLHQRCGPTRMAGPPILLAFARRCANTPAGAEGALRAESRLAKLNKCPRIPIMRSWQVAKLG